MVISYLWLLFCCAQYARGDVIAQYEDLNNKILNPKYDWGDTLPIDLGIDKTSGCLCRATDSKSVVDCFGGYECKRFPKVTTKSDVLRVRTTIIEAIAVGELDNFYYLKGLELEANHRLKFIETGSFKNLTMLEELSISYCTSLHTIYARTFEGLINVRNLTMVNNGYTNMLEITTALRPSILPSLDTLNLSENVFEIISKDEFLPMEGSKLKKLLMGLCQIDYIHPSALEPLKNLTDLAIGDNDLNATMIEEFLSNMIAAGINLSHLDISGMSFRKHPPYQLLKVIAKTTISTLILAKNQFEQITDNSFPVMKNIKVLDLRRVSIVSIGPYAFEPAKFPKLEILILSGNFLPGIHGGHLSSQLKLMDLSYNTVNTFNPMYFEMDPNTFCNSSELLVLNMSFNRIKSIYDYTFRGLDKLRVLNIENGTVYHIGPNTFKSTRKLKVLNLKNNPVTASANLTSAQFVGLNRLRVLNMQNCGIKFFIDDDNIFEMMPNLTELILRNNKLSCITPDTLKPLKHLKYLDLSDNTLVAWVAPLFLSSGVKLQKLDIVNNKISHFTIGMLQDIDYLLENNASDVDFLGNLFVCDCKAMFTTYTWIEVNATYISKQYFQTSKFQCATPDLWEDRTVVEYLRSVKSMQCIMYDNISNIMVFVWTTPSIILMLIIVFLTVLTLKYRIYIKYWLFLAKLALGRRFFKKPDHMQDKTDGEGYRYDAFISYSNEDREFVSDMICHLETYPPYLKLCVYERDFEIGSFISESIMKSINESRYIILIISNGFAKSQWCRWETQLAEYHRLFLKDSIPNDPLVLVRLGDIEPKYLTITLKFLLQSKVYLSWDENNPEDFWKRLRNIFLKHNNVKVVDCV